MTTWRKKSGVDRSGNSLITKLRYQLGGPTGYGYLQFSFRNQNGSARRIGAADDLHAARIHRRRR